MATSFKFKAISAESLYYKDLPPVEYYVNNFIEKGSLTYVTGPPGSFKTGLMINVAVNGAIGKKILNYDINDSFKTLIIDEENGLIRSKARLKQIVDGQGLNIKDIGRKVIFACISQFKLIDGHIEILSKFIDKNEINIVVIDNIARCLLGSERDEKDVSKILNLLKPLMEEEIRPSFVPIHHTRKGNPQSLEDISGSRDFGAQCDNAFLLKYIMREGSGKKFSIREMKNKNDMEAPDTNFVVSGDKYNLTVDFVGSVSKNIENYINTIYLEIINWLDDNPQESYSREEIYNPFKKIHKKSSFNEALQKVLKNGVIKRPKRDHYVVVKK